MSDREQYWAHDQSIRLCDATTGHSVRDVAFCDTPARAESFAIASRALPDLVKALEETKGRIMNAKMDLALKTKNDCGVALAIAIKEIDAALAKVKP